MKHMSVNSNPALESANPAPDDEREDEIDEIDADKFWEPTGLWLVGAREGVPFLGLFLAVTLMSMALVTLLSHVYFPDVTPVVVDWSVDLQRPFGVDGDQYVLPLNSSGVLLGVEMSNRCSFFKGGIRKGTYSDVVQIYDEFGVLGFDDFFDGDIFDSSASEDFVDSSVDDEIPPEPQDLVQQKNEFVIFPMLARTEIEAECPSNGSFQIELTSWTTFSFDPDSTNQDKLQRSKSSQSSRRWSIRGPGMLEVSLLPQAFNIYNGETAWARVEPVVTSFVECTSLQSDLPMCESLGNRTVIRITSPSVFPISAGKKQGGTFFGPVGSAFGLLTGLLVFFNSALAPLGLCVRSYQEKMGVDRTTSTCLGIRPWMARVLAIAATSAMLCFSIDLVKLKLIISEIAFAISIVQVFVEVLSLLSLFGSFFTSSSIFNDSPAFASSILLALNLFFLDPSSRLKYTSVEFVRLFLLLPLPLVATLTTVALALDSLPPPPLPSNTKPTLAVRAGRVTAVCCGCPTRSCKYCFQCCRKNSPERRRSIDTSDWPALIPDRSQSPTDEYDKV